MPAELDRHPQARAVLEPALADGGRPSHAYLFHGPGGSGKRAVARSFAASLLSEGSFDADNARARVMSGSHPDLTWVAPSGAHEILVSDIAEPVIAAASKTPFESTRRVFVIERVDELGDEAANRMLKTLEEPASFVHLILLTDRLVEVLPTIRSRCQLVRFEAPSVAEVAEGLVARGTSTDVADACARLSLGDASSAAELAGEEGALLREGASRFAVSVLGGTAVADRPWLDLLRSVRARGDAVRATLEAERDLELELVPRKERKRVETEWTERIRRARRRAETGALDLGLQLVSLWLADLMYVSVGADDLVRNTDRRSALGGGDRPTGAMLRAAIEHVEETRQRFQLNVSEELACEALAYRLERTLHS